MAKRYSGAATVRVVWSDERSAYHATIATGGRNVWTGEVGAPAALTRAVDCPGAYDDAARAALAFADADTAIDPAWLDYSDAGIRVARSLATRRDGVGHG